LASAVPFKHPRFIRFISAICPKRKVPFRGGLWIASFNISTGIAAFISGHIASSHGYLAVFSVMLAISITGLIIASITAFKIKAFEKEQKECHNAAL